MDRLDGLAGGEGGCVNHTRVAAQHLAVDLGWPVMPVKAHGKDPLTPHGVKDATTDERTILHWFERWPDANLAVATGAPGPTVLDVDNPDAAQFLLRTLEQAGAPEVATARGRHLYYHGLAQGTVSLGYGELRGQGSYVVCPPSVHPTGKSYVWLVEPHRRLPAVPAVVAADRKTAGVGDQQPRERVAHGERHDHLKDTAVRLLRAGIVDQQTIERHLRAEYDAVCDPNPPARPDEFRKLAEWAMGTRIARREQNRAEHREAAAGPGDELAIPKRGAPLATHAAFLAQAGGWAGVTDIRQVRRGGGRTTDPVDIYLANGSAISFSQLGHITTRGSWNRAVIAGTGGQASPPQLKDWQLGEVLRSLCLLSGATPVQIDSDSHRDVLAAFLALCEPVIGHHAQDSAARFELIEALRLRANWDPFDRNTVNRPALITDSVTSDQYVRAGELWDYFRFRGVGIGSREFPGRMLMIDLTQVRLNGREPRETPGEPRRTKTALFYRLPLEEGG